MLKNKLQLSALILMVVAGTNVYAGKVHTWSTVSSLQGNWHAKLAMINEDGYFVDKSEALLSNFDVSPGNDFTYGFGLGENVDFNLAYSLTLTAAKSPHLGFTSKACVFIVTAPSPAKPDVHMVSYNGAVCGWTAGGHGVSFTVST